MLCHTYCSRHFKFALFLKSRNSRNERHAKISCKKVPVALLQNVSFSDCVTFFKFSFLGLSSVLELCACLPCEAKGDPFMKPILLITDCSAIMPTGFLSLNKVPSCLTSSQKDCQEAHWCKIGYWNENVSF